jgi:ketosteroid isomerase-like protein
MTHLRLFCAAALVAAGAVSLVSGQAPAAPQAAIDELLAADRAFAAAAPSRTVVEALAPMMASDAVMPTPAPGFARGKDKIVEALSGNPDNIKGTIEWFPSRAGISADGQHGFTVGYMTLVRPDSTRVPVKYLAYWVKQSEGWRVAVYKRSRSAEGAVPRDLLPPALPTALVKPSSDGSLREKYRLSLEQAEKAFSDEAQTIGIGPAFAKHGSADAMNMGGPDTPTFIVGSEAIGRNVGAGRPANESSVTWAADYAVLVASSGDLGVTMGMIRRKGEVPAGQPAAVPFVTIWRRASPSDPWRYVAE